MRVAAAYTGSGGATGPNNTRASPYTSPSGADMPGPRDLYEGTTGIDVLALQKDLVAEGYLTPSDATGCVSRRATRITRAKWRATIGHVLTRPRGVRHLAHPVDPASHLLKLDSPVYPTIKSVLKL